ncbi:MAG: hypothetical protein DRP35_10855 [Candidatus Zixiibacteriota bacterium]|nr:MAG: hypothetical protein DRP35_10855 [candidate division Zixibacteria bacterium]
MKLKALLILGLALLVLLTVSSLNANEQDLDYKTKFIVKLVKFVEWPDGNKTGSDGNTLIAVIGNTALTEKINSKAKEVNSTNIVAKEMTIDDDFASAQIVFIATQDKSELPAILKKVSGKPILTISDANYFANFGVMINFFKENDSSEVEFEVNKIVVDDSGLKISSKLLKMAKLL